MNRRLDANVALCKYPNGQQESLQPAFPLVRGLCAPGGIRTPNLLIRSQMLYPLSHGCGRLMRPLAAEQHRESVSAQTAPTNREQRAQASASLAARTPLFRLTSLSNPGAAIRSPTR